MPSFISLAIWSGVFFFRVVGRGLIPEGILQRLVLEDLRVGRGEAGGRARPEVSLDRRGRHRRQAEDQAEADPRLCEPASRQDVGVAADLPIGQEAEHHRGHGEARKNQWAKLRMDRAPRMRLVIASGLIAR